MAETKPKHKIRIIRNAARCNHCGDVIESTYRHDFKTCSCGHVSVDGGHDYLRRCYASPDDYTDLSETEYLPLEEDRKRENLQAFSAFGKLSPLRERTVLNWPTCWAGSVL